MKLLLCALFGHRKRMSYHPDVTAYQPMTRKWFAPCDRCGLMFPADLSARPQETDHE